MTARRVFIAASICAALATAQHADLVLFNGHIVTADDQFRTVDAIAVRGDRLVAVGRRGEVLRHAGAGTRRIDLHGATVLPGLMDSHVHASEAAMYEFDHPVPDMETIADVLRFIRARAAVTRRQK